MAESFEVPEPILNSPFEEPQKHWFIREGHTPELRASRRPALVYPPRDQKREWDLSDGTLKRSDEYTNGYEMVLVGRVREQLAKWREQGYPGVTRTTLELLRYWRRDGRQHRLFYAQLEAAETIIFLREARGDFLQGINVPMEEMSEEQKATGKVSFLRYACKMATGGGKTTVMGMLAAWSILNKVNDRSDARFSDLVVVVCPNVTIRDRLHELDTDIGDASLYRKRDLVSEDWMRLLSQGRVIVTNWHVFEPLTSQVGGVSAKVVKKGKAVRKTEVILIGQKTATQRGKRYLTLEALQQQISAGMIDIKEEERDAEGHLKKVKVETLRYVESDTALLHRVLGEGFGGKRNVLVINDEAHHAYRIRREPKDEEEDLFPEDEANGADEEDTGDDFFKEATVWVEGLDKIQKARGVNFCLDLSATPYFLGRVGQDTNKPFAWVVSDFGLTEAIESGLVKIPQLAIRDTTGAETPPYFNIWRWMMEEKLTPAEKGGSKASPKPEAVLKYAHHPIAILAGEWEEDRKEWAKNKDDPRPPVFIIVCKNTKIAKVMFEWIAEGKTFTEVGPSKIEGFRNRDGEVNTIRVDSKVVSETDTDGAKQDESRWMRFTLDTVGRVDWPADKQGRPIYPEGFEALAAKLNRPLHPPGRDIRCIVSVGMLTEGWDCNTVKHIVGLRPFMSQLLCEQVVGRGLRRTNYDLEENGKFREEVAKVFGVPFEVIPYKADPKGSTTPAPKRHHVHAIPEKAALEIRYPRVDGYTQAIRNRITVDWETVPTLVIDPSSIPNEDELKGFNITVEGRPSLSGPGRADKVDLEKFREQHRVQELVFDLTRTLTQRYLGQAECEIPSHVLFPQVAGIVRRYLGEKLVIQGTGHFKDCFLSPYFGWLIERLRAAIRPDTSMGEAPEIPRYEANRPAGSTADVDYWTSKDVREAIKSHVNYVVADTKRWEQSATYYIDTHSRVEAFVKNAGLGFSIPYFHNGQPHDYVPDFIIRLKPGEAPASALHLILETKGYDDLAEVKSAAAQRWVSAVNAEGSYGRWLYRMVRSPHEITKIIGAVSSQNPEHAESLF